MAFLFIYFATAPNSSRHCLESLTPSHQPGKHRRLTADLRLFLQSLKSIPQYYPSSAENYLLCLPFLPTHPSPVDHTHLGLQTSFPQLKYVSQPPASAGFLWEPSEVMPAEKQVRDIEIFTLPPHLRIPSPVLCSALQQTACSGLSSLSDPIPRNLNRS